MGLALTPDQLALEAAVRDWTVAQQTRRTTRMANTDGPVATAISGVSWHSMTDLGWPGITLSEHAGGGGGCLGDLCIVVEGLGRELSGSPLVPTALAAMLVDAYGDGAQRDRLLDGLVTGTRAASVTTTAGLAIGATWASCHLIRRGEDAVVFDSASTAITGVDTMDASIGVARVEFTDGGEVLVGAGPALTRLLRTLVAAEATGIAEATLEIALAYAKVRTQFGRVIGSFQAIKHRLADMRIRVELAVAAAWDAAQTDQGAWGGSDGELRAVVAAAVCLDAAVRNAQAAIQVFGGIGFTWEHDAHLYLRRAVTLAGLIGPIAQLEGEITQRAAVGEHRRPGVGLPIEAEQHRAEVRAVVAQWETAPSADRRRLLVDTGYLVPHWPKPWGRGAGPLEQLVIEEELRSIDVPDLIVGGWVLLTLSQYGTPDQVERWIHPGLLGDTVWCQLFSEPDAGSDAAAVNTRGERVAGGWLINGQKVWTSHAHNAQRGLATVRTDRSASKHGGITTMVIDLTGEGVTRRPIREISGQSMFNEFFFDDVFVPDRDVVGRPGEGWSIARATLSNERVSIGGGSGTARWNARSLLDLDARRGPGEWSSRIGALLAEEQAADALNARAIERALLGVTSGVEGNISKLVYSDHVQRVTELGLAIAGAAAVTGDEPLLLFEYLMGRCTTIAGGTSEISRNVIAERILGLPRGAVFN
jgi:alkylation response protein AidB-like acyl-CoA dehydrogenase